MAEGLALIAIGLIVIVLAIIHAIAADELAHHEDEQGDKECN